MIDTEEVASTAQTAQAREQLLPLAQRPHVQKELQVLGIPPQQAAERVAAMTDAEVLALSGRLNALPAGAAMTNTELLIVILLVVLIALAL